MLFHAVVRRLTAGSSSWSERRVSDRGSLTNDFHRRCKSSWTEQATTHSNQSLILPVQGRTRTPDRKLDTECVPRLRVEADCMEYDSGCFYPGAVRPLRGDEIWALPHNWVTSNPMMPTIKALE